MAEPSSPSEPADEITVLIVDDHRSFSDMLAAALSFVPGMRCVGTASTAAQAVGLTAQLRPDVVVMDINMPGADGLEATRRVRATSPESVVAVVTAHTDPSWIARAAQAGASAFIGKNGSLDEVVGVLRTARRGQMVVAPSMYAVSPGAPPDDEETPSLSQQELKVLQLLHEGLRPRDVAARLHITENTCRGYVKSIRGKLGVASQTEAVLKAQQLRLIRPRPLD